MKLNPELPLNYYTHEILIKYMYIFSEIDINDWRNLVNVSINEYCKKNNILCFNYNDIHYWINNNMVQLRYLDIVNGLYNSYLESQNS